MNLIDKEHLRKSETLQETGARASDLPAGRDDRAQQETAGFPDLLSILPKERRSDMATKVVKKDRDVFGYRETVYRELSEMKAKILGIICKVEATTASEEARRAEYFDLFDLMDDIEDGLDSFAKERPSEWRGTREEIESRRNKLHEAVDWWFG